MRARMGHISAGMVLPVKFSILDWSEVEDVQG